MSTDPIERAPGSETQELRLTLPRAQSRAQSTTAATQIVLTSVAVFTACYFAKLPAIVLLFSILLAFILAPIVDAFGRFRIPRALAALIVVTLVLSAIAGVGFYSYSKAVDFAQDLPKYSDKIRGVIQRFQEKAASLQKSTERVLPPEDPKRQPQTIRVEQPSNWDWLFKGAGSVTEVVFACGFIPFLVYFMLSWQEHTRAATVMLFRMENRNTAYVTLGAITRMIRSFIIGNVLVGLFLSGATMIIFWMLGLPYFYFIGLISGFLSVIPYLGVVLAVVPPLVAGFGQIAGSDVLVIMLSVFGLHVFALNVLYPKFVGSRVQLNPLAVTLALLFWGFLWGAFGLILAIPLTAAMKIIFDHVEHLRPYGEWLGE